MKKDNREDIENLSLEELKKSYIALSNDFSSVKEELDEAKSKNDELEVTMARLIKELNLKASVIRRYNLERLVFKMDNAYGEEITDSRKDEAYSSRHTGRPVGSKSHGRDDLEELSRQNEPIVLDALDSIPDEEKSSFVRSSEEVGYRIEIVQKQVRVCKVIRPVYKKDGEEGTEILREPSHALIKGCVAGASMLADILMMKYGFGVPHYRYLTWLKTQPISIDHQTLYRWTSGAAEALGPVYEAIKEKLREAPYVHVDETPIRILDDDERQKGYVFVFSAPFNDRYLRIYCFSKTRETDIVDEVLGKDYKVALVADGYSGYDRYARVQRCWVHALRKWKDIIKGMPKRNRKGSPAERIVALFQKVFQDEHEISQIGYGSPEEKIRLRNEEKRKKDIDALIDALREIEEPIPRILCATRPPGTSWTTWTDSCIF